MIKSFKSVKTFKTYYNKEDFDYETGQVDAFEFHSTFYQMFVAFKVADIEHKEKPTFFNQNLFIFLIGLIGTTLSFCSLCHGLDVFDIPHIAEAGTYVLVLSYELLIQTCTKTNLEQYHCLLRSMKEDFEYICTVGLKYRTRFFENHLITWKLSIFAYIFTFAISIGMVIFATVALIVFLITHKPGEPGGRPLLFPFWLPDVDFSASPLYEIAFMYSNTCAILYSYNYIFMIQTEIVWIREITSKADIIIWSLEDLLVDVHPTNIEEERAYFRGLLVKRLREIVIHHQSMFRLMEDYAKVYKKMLMFEQKVCGSVACLTAFGFAQKMDEGEFQAILLLLGVANVVLHSIPCYLCTFLATKVRSICDACWDTPFWNADPVIRPYMVLIMQRSLRPLPLQAAGFEDISLETFSKTMTSAYSLFNMLRQTDI